MCNHLMSLRYFLKENFWTCSTFIVNDFHEVSEMKIILTLNFHGNVLDMKIL